MSININLFKWLTVGVIISICFLFLIPLHVHAQTEIPQEKYFRAKVTNVVKEEERESFGTVQPYQELTIEFLEGPEKGKLRRIQHGEIFSITKEQLVKSDETVIIAQVINQGDEPMYYIADTFRLNNLLGFVLAFFVLVIIFSRWQGVGSIIGLGFSLLIILKYIVPNIVSGKDPLLISIFGSLMIAATTMYLAHGFKKQTTIAIVATLITLFIVGLISILFVKIAHLSGLGSEDAYALRLGTVIYNYRGLLLGGIIIGALGVLDDITTAQTAAVYELAAVNTKLKFKELTKRALNIGKEHITSLVNTLVLAYAGASLPIFLMFVTSQGGQPWWVTLNSEFVSEEIVRTVTGSMGLVLAVPITTILAAYMVHKSERGI